MAISIEHISSTKKQCIATFSAQDFKQKYQQKFKAFKPKARIDGFRPGKIADSVIEKKFGLGIKQEALDELLQASWSQALDEAKLEPIAQPQVDIDPKNVLSDLSFQDLVIKFVFEINPQFDLIPLEKLNIDVVKTELSDDQVAAFERHVARSLSEQKVVEREAALKDVVVFDANFTVNGETSEEKNVSMFLDAEESNEDFVKNLIGKKAGEQVSFSYEGVPNPHNTMKSGDKVEANVTVLSVNEVILADQAKIKEHFKSINAAEDADYSDEKFQQQLREAAFESVKDRDFVQNKDKFLKALDAAYSFDVPEYYIQHVANQPEDKKASTIAKTRRDLALMRYYEVYKPEVKEQDVQRALFQYVIQNKIPFQYLEEIMKKNNNFRNMVYAELMFDAFVRKAIPVLTGEESAPVVETAPKKAAHKKHKHHEGCQHDHCDHDHA